MNDRRLDLQQVRRAFGRAAASYERHDALQREVEARLFDSLGYYDGQPQRVLDVGCGTGRGTALLKKRWRDAEVIALDVSLPMLRQARRHAGWWKPFARVCADGQALPFPDRSMDVVYSNLCMQWCDAPRAFFAELNRVLKPDGFLVASSLGPDTLSELRAAWAAAGSKEAHVGRFFDMHDIGDAALAAGLKDPVLDADHVTLDYPDVRGLLTDLKGLGATNADRERVRGLTGKLRFKAMLDAYETRRCGGRIPATWEIVTLHAWGLPEGFLPRYGGRETPFEVVKWAERPPRR
ncbi:MAG: malonyl-[acyl-carrier protein] O-methyltransferase BioC [Rhodanobacteraceae bacterium]|nr:MAG: malonyl-[acyl-carrier protein] O-methyltransferase BioC [Rhodanobacteraceae bacterium]